MKSLFGSGDAKNSASIFPVIIGFIFLISSLVSYILTRSTAHALVVHGVSYLFTPIGVALCMGWDNASQRNGLKNSPWFEKNKNYSIALRVMTGLSFLVAIPHIHALALDIVDKFNL